MKNKEIFYKFCLLICALIWGSTFVVIKDATNTMSSGFINAFRFTIGGGVLFIIYFNKIKNINKSELKHGLLMGITLFLGYYLQVLGMEYGSSAGKTAFLSATFCVMVPFLTWGVFKRKPDKFNVISAILCVIGVALVSLEGSNKATVGDLMVLVSTFFYAVNIMLTAEFSGRENNDSNILAFLQIAVVGVVSWIVVFVTNDFPEVYSTQAILGVVYLGVFATALCLWIQVTALPKVNPTSGCIILSLESVFGVIISILFYNEVMTAKLGLGFLVIFIGIIICETKLEFITNRFKNERFIGRTERA